MIKELTSPQQRKHLKCKVTLTSTSNEAYTYEKSYASILKRLKKHQKQSAFSYGRTFLLLAAFLVMFIAAWPQFTKQREHKNFQSRPLTTREKIKLHCDKEAKNQKLFKLGGVVENCYKVFDRFAKMLDLHDNFTPEELKNKRREWLRLK